MSATPPKRETLTEAFERGVAIFNAKTPKEKLRFFQEIGALSEDGRVTVLYGGDAPVCEEAMEARERHSQELFATVR